ncbi:P27 family phage terminase small subunit [Burkholderia cenocepacia]|uniref:P27 family phage terminase small subunit n=1 Tax=Burkholderia cenocepacia TaxID=95486 RepID=UPI001B9D7C50|nr:P27 family phage terminase small subunit [Burkholderia cenocepacia]MBR8311526.1 P27 family phage terminase small subunit [Burkholderia cenocepacia]
MQNAKKPIPTQLKLLAGNPGKRPLNTNEPQPETGIGPCPEWFLPEAEQEWNRIVPELERLGMLTKIDIAILEAHCVCYAEMVVTAKSHKPVKAALIGQLRILAAELGLSPSSRSRISVPNPNNDDPTEEFFN